MDMKQIVAEAQAGSEAAAETIIRKYEPRICDLARMLSDGNELLRSDLEQEGRMKVFLALRTYKPMGYDFWTYVYPGLLGCMLSYLRDTVYRQVNTEQLSEEDQEYINLLESMTNHEYTACDLGLMEAISRLPKTQRDTILTMYPADGGENDEEWVAKTLGVSRGMVNKRKHSALKRLRRMLEVER